MYICVCVCVYIYMYICTYVCMYKQIYIIRDNKRKGYPQSFSRLFNVIHDSCGIDSTKIRTRIYEKKKNSSHILGVNGKIAV